ncbi:hypothetical protein BS47DRAFT_1357616 [Hydnum rufescens UP504]|uniref:Uncharacterized protein n=1 Tax=Hydnum rufescens UP504 TaxID=1448309 RepID=A0A9P6B9V4_9AGAM|nr:hypothetical protein BS47DRAFT_1357616 [Hydnum rufescens UP504]
MYLLLFYIVACSKVADENWRNDRGLDVLYKIIPGHCLNQDLPPKPPRQQSHWLNGHPPNETPLSKKPPQPHTCCGRCGALGGVWFYIKFYLNHSWQSLALPNENLGMQLNCPSLPLPLHVNPHE